MSLVSNLSLRVKISTFHLLHAYTCQLNIIQIYITYKLKAFVLLLKPNFDHNNPTI